MYKRQLAKSLPDLHVAEFRESIVAMSDRLREERWERLASTLEFDKAFARIPNWDGSPSTWLAFEEEVEWWLETEPLNVEYNLAARFVIRQTGVARRRAQQLDVRELRAQQAVFDPDNPEVLLQPADLTKGIRRVMQEFRDMLAITPTTAKGESLARFHLSLIHI